MYGVAVVESCTMAIEASGMHCIYIDIWVGIVGGTIKQHFTLWRYMSRCKSYIHGFVVISRFLTSVKTFYRVYFMIWLCSAELCRGVNIYRQQRDMET